VTIALRARSRGARMLKQHLAALFPDDPGACCGGYDARMASEVPPSRQMTELLSGFQVSQALYVAAKLDLATLMEEGPRSVEDLAAASGAQAEPLGRLLRSLSSLGVFTMVEPGSFVLTPLGATLASGRPDSLRDLALTYMEAHYGPFSNLLETLTTGKPAAEIYFGQPGFEWLAAHPEQQACFTRAMANLTNSVRMGALSAYKLPAGDLVADIGGADGSLLAVLLASEPARRGIVFDLPHVVPAASQLLADRGLADRIDVVAGNFFDAVPSADIYVMSAILHDWDDAAAARLLTNMAAAGQPGARLVTLELVVPEGDQPHVAKMVDLNMLVMGTGKERTAKEFEALFASAGFRLDRIVETPTPFCFLEATLTGMEPTA